MKCTNCGWKYPSHMLSPLVTSQGSSGPVCGICALEISNRFHGLKRTSFQGEMAEANRIGAISWRRDHPNQAPKVN